MNHQLTLITTGDERSRQFEGFFNKLILEHPWLEILKETNKERTGPALLISPNIRFEAVPTDKWEPALMNFLKLNDSSSKIPVPVAELNSPAHLKLYIGPFCPFCPRIISDLLSLVENQPHLHLTVIDGEMFPEKASADQVRAAPTLILDDSVRWTGAVNMDEVISIVRDRDPAALGADSLRTLIENGAAEELARMMADSGKIFPAFPDLLTHEKWPLRLGAMVAFEYLLEQNRDLADEVIELLWREFDRIDNGIKGDVLYLFGQSGGEKVIERLKTVLKAPYPGYVHEAAEEALESIGSRE